MRLAISLKIHQFGLASPGGSLTLRTLLTRRSLLVKVPSSSLQAAAGKTTWAKRVVSVGKISWQTRNSADCKALLHVVDIRLGVGQVLAEDVEGLDLAVEQAVHHLGDHQAGLVGQVVDAPGRFELGPRWPDRSPSGSREDIGQRPHVAGALHVVLSAQRVDAAAFEAHVAQEHLEIGAGS